MKKFFLVGLLCASQSAFSQKTESSPAQIQLSKPSFIHVNDLANFSQVELELLQGNYIVFDGELTNEKMNILLNFHSQQKSLINMTASAHKQDDLDFVKNWQTENPEVKIIKRSEYIASPENVQNDYVKSRCLILNGESLTKEDILNY